jgi:HK97 family phage prohead protease
MSVTEDQERKTEAPERALLVREIAIDAEVGDGRTLEMRVVPFDEIGVAADPPDFEPYKEQFMAGAFSKQERAANRILLTVDHLQGMQGVVGHGVELREAADGYYGTFRLHETPDGEKALTLLRERVIEHGSVEFYALRSVRTRQGVVQRVKAHLDKLTLTRRTPVYSKTAVLGLREGTEQLPDEQMVDEEFLPVDADPELIARCRALGIQLPQRYEAHPAETDPSAEHADTSEDGTRQTEEATTSED